MLQECLKHLGYDGSEAEKVRWIVEREAAISALRTVCAEVDDNGWPDDLHLSDIIENHVAPHIDANE